MYRPYTSYSVWCIMLCNIYIYVIMVYKSLHNSSHGITLSEIWWTVKLHPKICHSSHQSVPVFQPFSHPSPPGRQVARCVWNGPAGPEICKSQRAKMSQKLQPAQPGLAKGSPDTLNRKESWVYPWKTCVLPHQRRSLDPNGQTGLFCLPRLYGFDLVTEETILLRTLWDESSHWLYLYPVIPSDSFIGYMPINRHESFGNLGMIPS